MELSVTPVGFKDIVEGDTLLHVSPGEWDMFGNVPAKMWLGVADEFEVEYDTWLTAKRQRLYGVVTLDSADFITGGVFIPSEVTVAGASVDEFGVEVESSNANGLLTLVSHFQVPEDRLSYPVLNQVFLLD